MTTSTIVPLYEVKIDAETGLWLSEPERVGEVDFSEWCAKADEPGFHFDHYEGAPDDDGRTETRALRCILVS